jgi:transcriptional regulator with GAF, ATPase, and Fis domain/tetratricopeptide (TPR) repeat protein
MNPSSISLDFTAIDQLNMQGWDLNRKDPKKAIELANAALLESIKTNYTLGIAQAKKTLGACNIWLSNHEDAVDLSFASIQLFKELELPIEEAQCYYNLGTNFYYLSDYDNALRYYMQCYRTNEKIGHKQGIADGLNGMGTVYYSIDDNEKAIESLQKSITICKEIGDYIVLPKALDGLGNAYANLNHYDEALQSMFECIEVLKTHHSNKQVEAFALNGIGNIYFKKRDFENAHNYFNKSINLRKEIGFKIGVASTLQSIGRLYLEQKNNQEALNYFNEAILLSKEINSKETLYNAYEGLSLTYENLGEKEKAFENFKKFHLIKEEARNEKADRRSKGLELQFKVEQAEVEKNLLENKNNELKKYFEDVVTLSEIGKKITSLLSVEQIIDTVYESVNKLIDATGFGVGVLSDDGKSIIFPGYMEKGVKMSNSKYSLDDDDRMAVRCFKNTEEIVIGDFEKEHLKYVKVYKKAVVGDTTESLIYLPLTVQNRKIGVITVQSFVKHAYQEYHVNILRNLAVYAAIGIENASLYQNLESKIEERTKEIISQKELLQNAFDNTRLLGEIGQEIISTHDLESIFTKLQNNINQLMDATCFSIRLYNPNDHTIDYQYTIEKGKRLGKVSVSMDDIDNYSVWCVTNKQSIFINDHAIDYKKYTKKIVVVTGDLPESLLFCPMMIGDKVVGVITVQAFVKNAYLPYHLDILKTLGAYTAIALENAHLLKNMEDEIKERTSEVFIQKEEIQKSYENTKLLSKIGKEISAELSIKDIVAKVYSNINNLMDANIFGIAIHRPNEQDLFFSGAMEKGEKLPDFSFSLAKPNIATRSFLNREEIVINDWDKEFRMYVSEDYSVVEGEMPESMIYLPLISKENVIGVMTVQSFEKNIYSDYHLNILRNLSLYIASALENANILLGLEEMVQERTQEIEKAYQNTKLLSQISKDISKALSVETIISTVYSNINTLMDATSFGIGIYNNSTKSIVMKGFIEKGVKMNDFEYFVTDERLASYCYRNKKEIFINNYFEEYSNYIKGIQNPVSGSDSASIIYVPLFLKEEVFGVLTVQSYEPNKYSEYHLDILKGLANTVATALENAILYESLEERVKERTAEVVKQKEIIQEKNKDITDSIHYALKIQKAILPSMNEVKRILPNSFVFYRPKDIVSGDFYWCTQIEHFSVFAVADCTGHGVPGAMMSAICNNLMTQVIHDGKISNPADALEQIDIKLTRILNQSDTDQKSRDSMDIALCAIDNRTNKLQFSGVNRPLIIIRNGELIEFKPDKFSLGDSSYENKIFNLHEVDLMPNDLIYIFSDGFPDQFGGDRGKKFKYRQLLQLLVEIQGKTMEQQHDLIDSKLKNWMGDLEQLDDVLVMGIQVA